MDEEEKSHLRAVENPPKLKASNFWRCCPIGKQYLPEQACPEGQPAKLNSKTPDEPRCPWWINSAQHHFCFWRYVKEKSDKDGMMKELVQSELAALFGWSNTKTHFMLKQAMAELTAALKTHGAVELLQELETVELSDMVVPDELPESSPGPEDVSE